MEIKLVLMELQDFKGIGYFSFVPEEKNVKIYGDNGTGKTTLADAFHWLLFGKDSNNKSDFEIKGLDAEGKVKDHEATHAVHAVFDVDGEEIRLGRALKEKWTKHRGTRKKEFTGHTTTFYVNGLEKKKKEYEAEVARIIPEELFKLLSNPAYFNEGLDWKKRREILLELVGGITFDEVVKYARKKGGMVARKLKELPDKVEGYTVEDYMKLLSQKQKEVGKTLDEIPGRIEEVQYSIDDLEVEESKEELEEKLKETETHIEELQDRIHDARNGGEINAKKAELDNVLYELEKYKREIKWKAEQAEMEHEQKINRKEAEVKYAKDGLNRLKGGEMPDADRLEEMLVELRSEWQDVMDEEFTYEGDLECPTCGQELPEEEVERARMKAESKFNYEVAKRADEIKQQAVRTKEQLKQVKEEQEKINQEAEKREKEIKQLEAELEEIKEQRPKMDIDPRKSPEYKKLMEREAELSVEVEKLKEGTAEVAGHIEGELQGVKIERGDILKKLSEAAQVEKLEGRLEELENKERELGDKYSEYEADMFLCESYIQLKVELLEKEINEQFQEVKFKLFEQQVNGGVKEVCETLVNGVPYQSGLNNAAKINAGLDIIRVLGNHYGVSVPVWLDNAESVTKTVDTNAQVIKLIVSEEYSELTVK